MMLALGMFVFMRQTLPHQTMQRESDSLAVKFPYR